MKQLIKTMFAILMATSFTFSFAGNPLPDAGKKIKTGPESVKSPAPSENNGGTETRYCKVPGLLTIYPNNIYHCALISTDACVFIPCTNEAGLGTGNGEGWGPSSLPGGVEVPEGQNFIGYYDEGNVFRILYVNSLSVTIDQGTNSVTITPNP